MAHSVARVLVVEDHEPFRRFICSVLQARCDLQVIGEVSDGLEAVQQAQALQPDLILLDIGLPGLNGIEAARRIRLVAAASKILFVSLESSPTVVQAALNLGALGYVVKSEAGWDLLTAVEAVMIRGEQFVSSVVADRLSQAQTPERRPSGDVLPWPTPPGVVRHHPVHFYPDDETLLHDFTGLITSALKAQSAVIVVTTESHRTSLIERLQGDGVNIAASVEQKRYIALDVADPLSPTTVSNSDPAGFTPGARDLIVEAARAATEANLPLVIG